MNFYIENGLCVRKGHLFQFPSIKSLVRFVLRERFKQIIVLKKRIRSQYEQSFSIRKTVLNRACGQASD